MNSGKKVKYIDSNTYVAEADEAEFTYDTRISSLPDSIRYFSKNYWTLNNNNEIIWASDFSNNVMFDISYENDSTLILKANKQKFLSDSINEAGILERNFDKDKWQLFLNNNIPNSSSLFEDHNVEFSEPVNIFDDPSSSEKNTSFIKKDYKYNFYSPKFEALVNDRAFDVVTLPSIFSILNDKNLDTRTYEENITLSLGGTIDDNYVESLFLANKYNDMVKKYFDTYADAYSDQNAQLVIETLSKNNVLNRITNKQLTLLKPSTFIPFPFYINTKFSNFANSPDSFIHQISSIGSVQQDLLYYILYNQENVPTRNFIYNSDYTEERTIKEYDIKDFITEYATSGTNVDSTSYIEYGKFIKFLKENVKNKVRPYSHLNKTTTDDQLIFYKIEKRQFNYTNNNPVQTFLIEPNTNELINFVDTQIKYGTEYYYTINSYMLVVGNSYYYTEYDYSGANGELKRLEDLENGVWRLNVVNNATYKIIEIPFAKFLGIVHEQPYTKPNISLKKDNDNIRIDILESEENSLEDIKIIENKDFTVLQSIKLSQNIQEKDKILCSRNTNPNNTLEIYKTLTRPMDFISLQGKLYKTLTLENKMTFTDSIVPDIKHYYAFRYLNNHGTPSNISKIFEVTMKNEDGYAYLTVEEVDLTKTIEKSIVKDFKRYLLLRPSLIQTQIQSTKQINTVDDINLGPVGESVWNKDFILRLTSKKTNRVLEFNLKTIINRKKD